MQQDPAARVPDSGSEGGRRHGKRSLASTPSTQVGLQCFPEYECAECGGKFIKKTNYFDHDTVVHTDRKVYPLCPETFNNTKQINRHMSQIHRIQRENHACCKCGKKISRKQSLTNHGEDALEIL